MVLRTMTKMFAQVITWLEHMAQSIPLPLFVIIGGLVEEIVAPIPSPLVSTLSGSIVASQNMGIPGLLWICVLSTFSKTFGAWLFYVLGDKFEDLAVPRFGKWIGVGHEEVERFGARFSGTWKDVLLLTVLRAIPVMPSTPLSVACGIIKIRQSTFLIATYIGFYIRNLTFLALGYTGLSAIDSLMQGIDTTETILKALIVVAAVGLLGFLYWRRGRVKKA